MEQRLSVKLVSSVKKENLVQFKAAHLVITAQLVLLQSINVKSVLFQRQQMRNRATLVKQASTVTLKVYPTILQVRA